MDVQASQLNMHETKEESELYNLPDEVWLAIFSMIENNLNLSLVNRRFKAITRDRTLHGNTLNEKALKVIGSLEYSEEEQRTARNFIRSSISKTITKLDLSCKKLSNEDFDLLVEKLNGLIELNLSNTGITIQQITKLRDLKNLKTLCVSWNEIEEEGFKTLAKMKNLSKLGLSHDQLNKEGFDALNKLSSHTTFYATVGYGVIFKIK